MVKLDEVVVISVNEPIQGELRMELIHGAYWFLPNIWDISELDILLQHVDSETDVVIELIDNCCILTLVWVITIDSLNGERNPLFLIRVWIFHTELFFDFVHIRAKAFLNFVITECIFI